MLQPGATLGPYTLVAELGAGAMGRVYRARATEDAGGDVALKVLHEHVARDSDHLRRFRREAQALAAVAHPNVIDVVDVGVEDDRHYIAMRLLPGMTLDAQIGAGRQLSLDAVKRVVVDVAGGVDAVHAAGLTHRDIKPANVMVGAGRPAVLMDLGLAKRTDHSLLTAPHQLVGTIPYVAPELVTGGNATPQSDVYALGCMTYEAIAGRPPFTGPPVLVAEAHLGSDPVPLHMLRDDVPPSLSVAVGYALAKDPDRRPPSATAVASLVRAAFRDARPSTRSTAEAQS